VSTSTGYCNCCAMSVPLLTDVELNESVCTICRSYDVTRDSIRNAPSGKFSYHELASIFESAFDALEGRA
jgi:hypothetical protein